MARMKSKRRSKFKAAKRQATPSRISNSVRSDGLVLQVGVDGIDSKHALKLARKIVNSTLPGKWIIHPMGTDSREMIVRRPVETKNPTVSQDFNFAYKLRQHRDVEDCEPSLIMPVDAPEAMRVERTEFASASSSSGDDGHLRCSMVSQWAVELCKITDAWSLPLPTGGRSRGEGIRIGHPDTGYTDHPELDSARVLENLGFDFEDGDPNPRDTLDGFSGGHGTSTGSVIMSGENGITSVTGVAPLAELIPLRVTTSVVLFSFGKLAEAIMFAADQGHHVLSISLGGPFGSRFLRRAVRYATDRGVIIVAAAGNVWPFVVHPAKLDDVIAVAACNCKRVIWDDSASGPTVDITAPGESVWRALAEPNGFSIERSSGTSYATAMTAGAAALWLAHHGRERLINLYGAANVSSVFKELLLTKGFNRPTGWDTVNFGPGILNVKKLLSAALPSTVAAGGMSVLRATTAPRSQNQLDQLLDLFPTREPAVVRSNLTQMLGVGEAELTTSLRDVADEIAYHAVMDLDFRNRLTTKQKKKRKPAELCPRKMSPMLRRMTTTK